MSTATEMIEGLVRTEYKYGFYTDVEVDAAPPGLNEEIVRFISKRKGEPDWLTEWRLKAYRHWTTLVEPRWPKVKYPPIDYQSDRVLLGAEAEDGRAEEPGRGGSEAIGDVREAGDSVA
jgi:Fe-S cluster assembly protein SufB